MFHKMSGVNPKFFDLYEILGCYNDATNQIIKTFLAFELIKDNKGMTDTDPEFRKLYRNLNDAQLGDLAPKSMYIATKLG